MCDEGALPKVAICSPVCHCDEGALPEVAIFLRVSTANYVISRRVLGEAGQCQSAPWFGTLRVPHSHIVPMFFGNDFFPQNTKLPTPFVHTG